MERVFIHEKTGNKIVALNDIQADAFKNEGFVEVESEDGELEDLKKQAEALGIEFSQNIGVKKLKERIEQHLTVE